MSHHSTFKNRNTVLALDNLFRPMAEIPRRKAIKAIVTHRADAVVNTKTWETTTDFVSGMPLKIIIYKHATKTRKEPKLSTGNKGLSSILRRDSHICCYCGVKLKPSRSTHPHRATVDHIIPKAQGGQTTFQNLASCCFTCNQLKGNQTPEQASMKLIKTPQSPTAILLGKLEALVS